MFRFVVLEHRCSTTFLVCLKYLLVNQEPQPRVLVILDVETVALEGVWSLKIQ